MGEECKKLQDMVTAGIWDIEDWKKEEYGSPHANELQHITLSIWISTELCFQDKAS